MMIILLILASLSNAYQDCTNTFKNRVAHFESIFFPSYWLYPQKSGNVYMSWVRSQDLNNPKLGVTWLVHDCGNSSVCLESKKPGWKNFFIGSKMKHGSRKIDILYKSNLHDTVTDSNLHKKIFCSSCTPSTGDIWHDCKLMAGDEWLYTDTKGFLKSCSDCGDPRWFKWRIVSPPTQDYWRLITSIDNCAGKTSLPVSQNVRGFITSVGVSAFKEKIEKGLEARDILSMNQKSSIRNNWDTTNIKALARGRSVALGGMGACGYVVQPCHVWRLYQLEGHAGYTTIGTKMIKSEQEECFS